MLKSCITLATLLLISLLPGIGFAVEARPRVVLMDDPELDDQNTVIRFLLYSNEFDVQGLLYASSSVHWAGDGKGTLWMKPDGEYRRFGLSLCPCASWRWQPGERFIDDAVDRYAQVYPNLRRHASGYAPPEVLRSKILVGNIEFDGDISKDSPGSRRIEQLLLDDRPGHLYLLSGAGQSTIARALQSIELTYRNSPRWQAIYKKISAKAVIAAFGDQDRTYKEYIQPHWPDIEFRQVATRIWGYGARDVVLPQDAVYLTAQWTRDNVSSRGPMGAFYRVWGDGRQMVPGDIFDFFGRSGESAEQLKKEGFIVWMPPQPAGSWISEGDTSIFLNLLDNGLRSAEKATFGGWGGRAGVDHNDLGETPADYAAARWFGAAQRDFAARMMWTVTSRFQEANHAPRLSLKGSPNISVRPGQKLSLQVSATDPDGNAVRLKWWQYTDAGTFQGRIQIESPEAASTAVRIPDSISPGETIHVIVEATDDGTPSLTAYQRIILTAASK